jgi:catechol 2,3-dioxygenase-like lactoylglutathione lyase family enzyme
MAQPSHRFLECCHVDHWADRLSAAGYRVDGPDANERFGIYHCFVRDPDRHLVEIQRFDEPL